MANTLILNLDALPLSACSELAHLGRRNAEFNKTRPNFFGMIHFRKNASANPLVSHTFKTKDLKPFRFIHFQKKVWGVPPPAGMVGPSRPATLAGRVTGRGSRLLSPFAAPERI